METDSLVSALAWCWEFTVPRQRSYHGRFWKSFPAPLKGGGVWKPIGSSLGRSGAASASACGCLIQLHLNGCCKKIMPA